MYIIINLKNHLEDTNLTIEFQNPHVENAYKGIYS